MENKIHLSFKAAETLPTPVAANMTILAGTLGKHEIASARIVFVSTLLSLLTIPLIASLIPPVT